MRHFDVTFWWEILMRQFDESYWWDILKNNFDEKFKWDVLMRRFNETFLWDVLMRYFDETFGWDIYMRPFGEVFMRHFDQTFWWELILYILIIYLHETFSYQHFDDTFCRDTSMRHIDETPCCEISIAFEKLWLPVMTFDNLWYGDDVHGMALWQFWLSLVFNRPGVARTVLQTPPPLIKTLNDYSWKYLQNTFTLKS